MSAPANSFRDEVIRRAGNRCEYCQLPQRASVLAHQIDHIIAQQHMGSDQESNLCLCCLRWNTYKGPILLALILSAVG